MTKSKNTKRALLASVLSMMLCLAMLIGSTFAWFTDSVTSGVNKIVAGNLDVELEYRPVTVNEDGTTTFGEWTPVDPAKSLFKPTEGDGATLWEPGHVETVNLKVANLGTLALTYQLGINIASEKGSTNVNDEAFKLSDYIKFAVLDGEQTFADRDAAIAAADATAVDLSAIAVNEGGVLYPNGKGEAEKLVTLVVYMPTTVGNEANYKTGYDAPEIELGIKLVAAQTPFEEDSFGNTYDGNAEYPPIESTEDSKAWYKADENSFTIKNGNELAYLAELVNAGTDDFAGKNITLANDIVLPAGDWVAIGTYEKPFKGTFDGADHTVSNVMIHDNDGTKVGGFFGAISNADIKNLTVSGEITLGGLQGDCNDAFISGNGGICAYANNSTISKCINAVTIDATNRKTDDNNSLVVGGIVGFGNATTVDECKNEGNITVPGNTIAGGITSIIGTWSGSMTVTITNSDDNTGVVSGPEDAMVGSQYGVDTDA